MKCSTIIDPAREEEVIVYAHKHSPVTERIEAFVADLSSELIGYSDNGIHPLRPEDIFCVTLEEGKPYAVTHTERYRLKERLYRIEELLGGEFVKINQSCIINTRKIEKFSVSLGGALLVILKNGYKDYVARRQLKEVKERIGFRL